MKTAKILAILVLVVGQGSLSKAVPMGTAWTYQGRLMDANEPADGEYDLQFKLFDSIGLAPLGTIDVNEVDVIDGYFTVALDFGSDVFNGDARWLEIVVRPGDSNDTDAFVRLVPRQEVTPTPYASYAGSAGGVSVPLDLSGSSSTGIIMGTNTGSGYGIYGEASYIDGSGVYGYGRGDQGRGVYGTAAGDYGSGVYGVAKGDFGRGVYGEAFAIGNTYNFGGYFVADGNNGRGVHGEASGDCGMGVRGLATASGNRRHYGGYFEAKGPRGRGVLGYASNLGNVTNYGGFFVAYGSTGRGIYGYASATSGTNYGVYGKTDSSEGYAGYFEGGKNYFEGNVGIGTNSPQRKLHISDVIRIEPRSDFPSDPSDGDVCVVGASGDRHIYCYLNGDWIQLGMSNP